MDNPFIYEKPVEGHSFTGRKHLLSVLKDRMMAARSTIILSCKGWGMSSLILELLNRIPLEQHEYRLCRIDLQPKDQKDDILTKLKDTLEQLYGVFNPGLRLSTGDDWDLLLLPELIGNLNDTKIFIWITGLHHIASTPVLMQLLTHVDKAGLRQKQCAYLLCGNSNDLPGLHPGKDIIISLKRIRSFILWSLSFREAADFVRIKFLQSGKKIRMDACREIAARSEGIPHFLQLIAWLSWEQSTEVCTIRTVKQCIDRLCNIYRPDFQNIMDHLTVNQEKCLRSLCNGYCQPYAEYVIKTYGIPSKNHVSRALCSLKRKGIITGKAGTLRILNPLLRKWIQNQASYYSPR